MKEKQTNEERIVALRKALLKRKYFSIFLALFTLGINIFAWFVFSTSANVGLDATVASWHVQFRNEDDIETQTFVINITKMKPGMNNFSKTISVYNQSDVTADFEYVVDSFTLLGHTIQKNNQAAMLSHLQSFYPFSVTFTPSKVIMNPSDTIQFDIGLVWPYESNTTTYFRQDEVYAFEPSFIYYQLVSDEYTRASVTSDNYSSLKSNLYLEKDDADSFFGMKCNEYETTTGEACLSLSLRLLVKQRNE